MQSIDWNGYECTATITASRLEDSGFVKINFPNKDLVHMHEHQPLNKLFGRNVRFESSGRVRVHIEALVAWTARRAGLDMQRVPSMSRAASRSRASS